MSVKDSEVNDYVEEEIFESLLEQIDQVLKEEEEKEDKTKKVGSLDFCSELIYASLIGGLIIMILSYIRFFNYIY